MKRSKDCGNSQKSRRAEDIAVAFACADAEAAAALMLTHGKLGAVNGVKGDAPFCPMIEFASAKHDRAKRIRMY